MTLKVLKYLINDKTLLKWFLKKPFLNTYRYLRAPRSFPFFGVKNEENLKTLLKDKENPLILGFSYCLKPTGCPSSFFSKECLFDEKSPHCQSCTIAKYRSNNFIIITTALDLAKKLIDITSLHPRCLFIICACPLAISLFKNFSNVLSMKGMALVLEGSVCTSFECFLLAEKGKKYKSTSLPSSQRLLLDDLLSCRI